MRSNLYNPNNRFTRFGIGFNNGGGISPADTLTQGLIWYYKMEEASNATRIDSSLSGLDLSSPNLTPQVAGVIDFAASFPDSNSKLVHTYDSLYDLSDTDFTITGWVNFSSIAANQHVVYIGNGASSNSQRVLNITYQSTDNEIRFVITDLVSGSSNRVAQQIAGDIPTNEYIFVAVMYTKSTNLMEISLNNQAPDTLVIPGNPQELGDQSFVLGNDVINASPLSCCIDEVGGYNRRITEKELTYLFNGGPGGIPGRPNFILIQNVTNADSTLVTNADLTQVTT